MVKALKKRRQPRKRAVTLPQVQAQLERYNRLLNEWMLKAEQATARLRKYRKKAQYYQDRVDQLEAEHLRELEAQVQSAEEALGRQLRSVRID